MQQRVDHLAGERAGLAGIGMGFGRHEDALRRIVERAGDFQRRDRGVAVQARLAQKEVKLSTAC
ncbi:hypothetical protein D3C71_1953720 [compost metagenome]